MIAFQEDFTELGLSKFFCSVVQFTEMYMGCYYCVAHRFNFDIADAIFIHF